MSSSVDSSEPPAPSSPTVVRRLGDFTLRPRSMAITALAFPIGGLSAVVAWCLLRLIGLITNLIFYGRVATGLVAPGAHHHSPALPVVGRDAPDRLIGIVTLVDVLRARRIDLEEERVSERVFHVRQFVPLPGGGVKRESEQSIVSD